MIIGAPYGAPIIFYICIYIIKVQGREYNLWGVIIMSDDQIIVIEPEVFCD